MGNFEIYNSGVGGSVTGYALIPFQHINRTSGASLETASITIRGNVSVLNGKHTLTFDGYASLSNRPSVKISPSFINIKYSWDKSRRLATKYVIFAPNQSSHAYPSYLKYIGKAVLELPTNSNDIKRLTVTSGVSSMNPSMVGSSLIVGIDENLLNIIKY